MLQTSVKFEWNKDLSNEILEKIDRGFDDTVDEAFAYSQDLVAKQSTDEGTLLDSGHVEREWLEKDIIYEAIHSAFIEFGTSSRQKLPPIEAIYGWVWRNRGKFNIKVTEKDWVSKDRGVHKRRKKGTQLRGHYKPIWKLAWAIAISIKEHGTQPKPFMRPTMHLMEKKAVNNIMRRL